MGFLERAIRRGVSDAVGKAVGNAVRQAVEPAATNLVNQATQSIDQATQNSQQQAQRSTAGLEGAMSNLESKLQGYATEAAKNTKVCPNCGKPNGADKKYCADCGSKLPEQTLAEGAVCTECGTQNNIGTKFCQNCGTKLPAAIQDEQAKAERDAAIMAEWDAKLPLYPKWNCGGTNFEINEYEVGYYSFSADFAGNHLAASQAVESYKQILLQNGFRQAGQYPSMNHLYKMVDGVCFHVDTEHCFEGDPDCPAIGFDRSEPYGGFNYVKPEPKKATSLKDLFGL